MRLRRIPFNPSPPNSCTQLKIYKCQKTLIEVLIKYILKYYAAIILLCDINYGYWYMHINLLLTKAEIYLNHVQSINDVRKLSLLAIVFDTRATHL